jgi:hypothetical protein
MTQTRAVFTIPWKGRVGETVFETVEPGWGERLAANSEPRVHPTPARAQRRACGTFVVRAYPPLPGEVKSTDSPHVSQLPSSSFGFCGDGEPSAALASGALSSALGVAASFVAAASGKPRASPPPCTE